MVAEPLSPEAFAPFGDVIRRPDAAPDATGPGWSWWAGAGALDTGRYAVGYLALEPAEPAFDWAEYHAHSAELIVPLSGECVVYVAEPGTEPAGFRAFRVTAGDGVILAPGVWHGAPLALDAPLTAAVLLLEGTDTVVTRFTPIPLEV
jgi:ureidoglycolate lyase